MLVKYLRKSDRISEKTFIKLKKSILPMGIFLLAISLILNRFFQENGIIAFISGLLMGLSIVANIVGIIVSKSLKQK